MAILTIDFESTYSTEYSLRKMSEVEYIMDPRFQVIMCATKLDNNPTEVAVGHEAVHDRLHSIDWKNCAVNAHNCVTGDTEVLTLKGWVRFDELLDGIPVAQFAPATGAISFADPLAVVRRPYKGPLYVWDTQFHQGVYTPDHRMYYSTPDVKTWRVGSAADVALMGQNNVYIPSAGELSREGESDLTPLEARLLEAIRADGSITRNGVRFKFSKQRKIDRLRQLCTALNVSLSESPEGRPGVVSVILHTGEIRNRLLRLLSAGCGETTSHKALSWDLLRAPLESRQAFLDELQHWDGRFQDASIKFATVSDNDRDVIQAVAVCSGYRSRFSTSSNARGFNAHNLDAVLHRVALSSKRRAKLVRPPKLVEYEGTVYCVTVPSGAFVVRRNGVVWITGNCRFDGAILGWHFNIYPPLYLDTMSMARAVTHWEIGSSSLARIAHHLGLPAKGDEIIRAEGKRLEDFNKYELADFVEYCKRDTDICKLIFDRLRPQVPSSELRWIDLLLRMFIRPQILLDPVVLENYIASLQTEKREALARIAGFPEIVEAAEDYRTAKLNDPELMIKRALSSNPRFAKILEKLGVEVPLKPSPSTGLSIPALSRGDRDFRELCQDAEQPLDVQLVLAARIAAKSTIEETRALKLASLAERRWPKGKGWAPVTIRAWGARTGRPSGEGGLNWLNLRRGASVRDAIKAPPGMRVVHRDSSQIEARMVAWLANCTDLLDAFAEGRDVYCEFASIVFGHPVTKADILQRFIGKSGILGLGYGCGAAKFRNMLFLGSGGVSHNATPGEAQQVVDAYRDRYPEIAELWRGCDWLLRATVALANPSALQTTPVNGQPLRYDRDFDKAFPALFVNKVVGVVKEGVILPNGMKISYPNIRRERNPTTSDVEFLYDDPQKHPVKIYGAKLCLGADTEVLTDRGWVPIVGVTTTDRVWDGEAWVAHDGVVYNGRSTTITVDGVDMTPDHKILTVLGWRDGQTCEGLDRYPVWISDRDAARWFSTNEVGQEASVGDSLRLRQADTNDLVGIQHRCAEVVRVQAVRYGSEVAQDARNVETPSVCGLAVYDRPLRAAYASGMEELRGARRYGMPGMARVVRDVLGGYGCHVPTRPDAGAERQHGWIFSGELRVGNIPETGEQSPRCCYDRYSYGRDDYSRSVEIDRYRAQHFAVSGGARMSPVFDIVNAGPGNRFVVAGKDGPFIVHNCENISQGLSRIVVSDIAVRVFEQTGRHPFLTTYDSLDFTVPESEVEGFDKLLEREFALCPSWSPGLPLASEGGYGVTLLRAEQRENK